MHAILQTAVRPRPHDMGRQTCVTAALVTLLMAIPGCGPRRAPAAAEPQIQRHAIVFGLTFEERMALPSALSRLRGEAERRAAEIYDPFRSREDAVRNEEHFALDYAEAKRKLLDEKGLSEDNLARIIEEYQVSRGAELR